MTTDQLTRDLEEAIRERDEARAALERTNQSFLATERERDALKEAQKRNNETVWRWRREAESSDARIKELKAEHDRLREEKDNWHTAYVKERARVSELEEALREIADAHRLADAFVIARATLGKDTRTSIERGEEDGS